MSRDWRRALWLGPGVLGSLACIIPDSQIIVREDFSNAGAVRIVEPVAVTERATDACDDLDLFNECPSVPATQATGLVRGNFCVCPDNARDGDAAGFFEIFVEDPDVDDDGVFTDDVFGAFLLDVDETADSPDEFVAYRNFLPPDQPADLVTSGDLRVIERAPPGLRSWRIGQERVDLCNDNDGMPLTPGLHELRIVVTDRPWYEEVELDDDGAIVLDEEGEPMRLDPVVGAPDLPAGATYDTRAFVFQCGDGVAGGENTTCNCVAEEAE